MDEEKALDAALKSLEYLANYYKEAKEKAKQLAKYRISIEELGESQGKNDLASFEQTLIDVGLEARLARTDYYAFLSASKVTDYSDTKINKLFRQVSYGRQAMELDEESTKNVYLALGDMISTNKVTTENLLVLGKRFRDMLVKHKVLDAGKNGILELDEMKAAAENGKLTGRQLAEKLGGILETTYNAPKYTEDEDRPAYDNRLESLEEFQKADDGKTFKQFSKLFDANPQALKTAKQFRDGQDFAVDAIKKYEKKLGGSLFSFENHSTPSYAGYPGAMPLPSMPVRDHGITLLADNIWPHMQHAISNPASAKNEIAYIDELQKKLKTQYGLEESEQYGNGLAVILHARANIYEAMKGYRGPFDPPTYAAKSTVPSTKLSNQLQKDKQHNLGKATRIADEGKFYPKLDAKQRVIEEQRKALAANHAKKLKEEEAKKLALKKQTQSLENEKKQSSAKTSTQTGAGAGSHAGSASKGVSKGGAKSAPCDCDCDCAGTKCVTINIGKLADFTINTSNVIETGEQIKDIISNVLLEVLNDANQPCE